LNIMNKSVASILEEIGQLKPQTCAAMKL